MISKLLALPIEKYQAHTLEETRKEKECFNIAFDKTAAPSERLKSFGQGVLHDATLRIKHTATALVASVDVLASSAFLPIAFAGCLATPYLKKTPAFALNYFNNLGNQLKALPQQVGAAVVSPLLLDNPTTISQASTQYLDGAGVPKNLSKALKLALEAAGKGVISGLENLKNKLFAGHENIVIVGAGPIGLWTAIQIKELMPNVGITILEKHSTYQRTHHLRINQKSLPEVSPTSHLYEMVQYFKMNRNPRTSDMEEILSKKAKELGINILKDTPYTNLQQITSLVPNAKVIIGADGSHSAFRSENFGKLGSEDDLQYLAELKYDMKGDAHKRRVALGGKLLINTATGTYNKRFVGNHNLSTNVTPGTIRTMINKEQYEKLAKWATFRNPKSIEDLKINFPEIHAQFSKWLKKSEDEGIIIPNSDKISVTKLATYRSSSMAREITDNKIKRALFLVGDSAFGVPFFRSMNNGLISGTLLAKHVYSYMNGNTKAVQDYNSKVSKLANWEIFAAKIKSFFIATYSKLLSYNLRFLNVLSNHTNLFKPNSDYLSETFSIK